MVDVLSPESEQEMAALVAEAAEARTPLEICGSGSKSDVGRPLDAALVLRTPKMTGITLYEPAERVIRAQAGTPLKLVQDSLLERAQELAFEPIDLGAMFGHQSWQGTIGSVFAMNLSGSRRLSHGAARDHFLGVRAVTGRGEIIQSGGRTMKRGAGYDLCRGLAGSWGTLAVMSEVTMQVAPIAEEIRTVFMRGLDDTVAVEAMCAALGTRVEVSGTMHLCPEFVARLSDADLAAGDGALTAFRLESFSAFLEKRGAELTAALAPYGSVEQLDHTRSGIFWSNMRELKFLSKSATAVWRLSTAPSNGPRLVSLIGRTTDCRAAYDWSGGLIWLEVPERSDAAAVEIRHALSEIRGHATLLKAPAELRAAVDVFQPPEPRLAALTRRLKQAFDPNGILNPGRMYPGV